MSKLRQQIAELIERAEEDSHSTGYDMDWAWDAAGEIITLLEQQKEKKPDAADRLLEWIKNDPPQGEQ